MARTKTKPKPDRLSILTDRIDALTELLTQLADEVGRLSQALDRATNNQLASQWHVND